MIAAAVLVLIVIAYRVVLGIAGAADLQWLHNFSPLAAIALCGAIYFPRKAAFAFPLGALCVSDVFLNLSYHLAPLNWFMFPQYLALAAIGWLGWRLRSRPSVTRVFIACIAGSLLFYLVTNTGSWLLEPAYVRSVAGWWQALTLGLPGYPPTLTFFRHSLASDLIFTALFLACLAVSRSADEAPAEPESLRARFARRLR